MEAYANVFDNQLEEGEQLEWVGMPEPFRLFNGTNLKSLCLRWLICVVIAVVVANAYISYSSITHHAGSQLHIIAAASVGVPLLISITLMPFRDKSDTQRKLIFALTDKRAITYTGFNGKFYSMDIDEIDEIKIMDNRNDKGHVILGWAAIQAPEKRMREIALTPKTTGNKEKIVKGMVFYNVGQLGKVKGLLGKL